MIEVTRPGHETHLVHHLSQLVESAGRRPPGSPANRVATDLARATFERAGLAVQALPFQALWWRPGTATIVVGGERLAIEPPPFCRSAAVTGRVVGVASERELAGVPRAAVVVLRDTMAEPLFPRAFPFLELPEQRERIARLEAAMPAAILAVADDPASAPVFEDPDLAFPYATITPVTASALTPGAVVGLEIDAVLERGDAEQLAAGTFRGRRAVVSAHLDSKVTTPGALDNGGGLSVLLSLAESGMAALGRVELVPFNGEDHFDAPGEQAWLADRDLGEISLAINIDGAGLRGYPTAVSTLGGDDAFAESVQAAVAATPGAVIGEPWFESDHALFAMRGIPSVAITSGAPSAELKRLSHGPEPNLDHMDPLALAAAASFVRRLLAGASGPG